jgi:rRNA small subunit pseudouridine methyltransferase Nep1
VTAVVERVVLVLVEAGLETVPAEISEHPAVRKFASRKGKKPTQVLLDRSYHHHAMKPLKNGHKRGRPDIVHFCLLEALGSPLNNEGLLEVYVSTLGGYTLEVNTQVRLPRVYERFKGVIEQLFEKGVVEAETGDVLLRLEKEPLEKLLARIKPSLKVLLSERGSVMSSSEIGRLLDSPRPAFMVGAFPHGDFTPETRRLADVEVSIWGRTLDAWTVVSRVLCWAEQAVLTAGKT